MRLYHVVDAVVDPDGSLTADVPAGVSWVGQTDGSQYLVVTSEAIPGEQRAPEAQVRNSARSLIQNGATFPNERDPLDVWRFPGAA